MNFIKSHKIIIIACALIFLIIGELFIVNVLYPKYVYATWPSIDLLGGPASIWTAILGAYDQVKKAWDGWHSWIKEVIQYAAYLAFFTVMNALTNAIIEWINSDFNGKPAFVQNYKRLLNQAVDNVAGSFIDQLGLGFLCENIDINIMLPLLQPVKPFPTKASCTLSAAIGNIQDFYNDFEKGGFGAFLELGKMRNNQIGATLLAIDELALKKIESSSEKKEEIAFGQGFFSVKTCVDEQYLDDASLNAEMAKRLITPESMPIVDSFEGTNRYRVCWKSESKNPSQLIKESAMNVGKKDFEDLQLAISNMAKDLGVFGPYVLSIANSLTNHIIKKGFAKLTKTDTARSYTKLKIPNSGQGDSDYSEKILLDLKQLRDSLLILNQGKADVADKLKSGQSLQREILNMLTWILVFNHNNFSKLSGLLSQTDEVQTQATTISEKLAALIPPNEPRPKSEFSSEISTLINLADKIIGIINSTENPGAASAITNKMNQAKSYLQNAPDTLKPSDLLIYAASEIQTAPFSLKQKLQGLILQKVPSFIVIEKIDKLTDFTTSPQTTTMIQNQTPSSDGLKFEATGGLFANEIDNYPHAEDVSLGATYPIKIETTYQKGYDGFKIGLTAAGIADGKMEYKTTGSCAETTIVKKTLVDSNNNPIEYSATDNITNPGSPAYYKGIFTSETRVDIPCAPAQSQDSRYTCQFFTIPFKIPDPQNLNATINASCSDFDTFPIYTARSFFSAARLIGNYLPINIRGIVLPEDRPLIERLKTTISAEQTFEETQKLTANLELVQHAVTAIGPFQEYFDRAYAFGAIDPVDADRKAEAWQTLLEAKNLAVDIIQPVIQRADINPKKIADIEELDKITSALNSKMQGVQTESSQAQLEVRNLDEQLFDLYNNFVELKNIIGEARTESRPRFPF